MECAATPVAGKADDEGGVYTTAEVNEACGGWSKRDAGQGAGKRFAIKGASWSDESR